MPFIVWTFILALVLLVLQVMALLMLGALLRWLGRMRADGVERGPLPLSYQHSRLSPLPWFAPACLAAAR